MLIIFFTINSVLADSWDDLSELSNMWDGQKTITNQEYEEVINALEEKKNEVEEKKNKKHQKKLFGSGSTLHSLSKDTKGDKNILDINNDDGIVLNVPVKVVISDGYLEKGYYKVLPEVDDETKNTYLKFYQSQFLKAKIQVTETDDDFGEETLDFAKLIPHDNSFVKLIFGSIKFNAYAYLPYEN
ncbi:hypothetical protein IKB17_01920 [bacterium]|nr:hypothetical protein [bacterium]